MNASPEPPNVSAIVVAYGDSPTLPRGVSALLAASGVRVEIIVVDNGVIGGALEELPSDVRVRTVQAPQNLGFGGGCNLGAAAAAGDVLVFVNPDAVAAPDALAKLAHAVTDPDVGIASGSVRLLGEPETMNSAGGAIHFLGLGWATGYGEPAACYSTERPVAAASGAAMAIRAGTFRALGGFTEPLFLYHEDAELSLRCWLSGRRVVFVPDARFDHDYEWSRHPTKLYFLERNRLVLVLTCYQRRTLLLLSPALLLYEVGMVAVAIAQGWGLDKLRGWRWLWQERSWLRSQRRRVQQQRCVNDADIAGLLAGRFDSPAVPMSGAVALADRALEAYWRLLRRLL